MIYGVGTDIVEINRIRKVIEKQKEAFLKRVFTQNEIREGNSRKKPGIYYAGRWAAKEALSKALGTGIGKECNWTDIEISNEKHGSPKCSIFGNAQKLAKKNNINKIHVSISHEQEYACSTVILECR